MASFAERVKNAIAPRAYDPCMRRSIQTAVLFEAQRVLASSLPELRVFQRKIAFWDMANYLVSTLDLLPHEKEEIMWRTGTSKEPMVPETAWKRSKMSEKEVKSLVEKMRPFLEGRTHEEACELFLQSQYEGVAKTTDKAHPPNWAYSHNNCFLTYFMYYRGTTLDPALPPPEPPKPILVPQERPPKNAQTIVLAPASASAEIAMQQHPPPTLKQRAVPRPPPEPAKEEPGSDTVAVVAAASVAPKDDLNEAELDSIVRPQMTTNPETDGRLGVLAEVRQHLDLLKEFEGIISDEELNSRKRELYMALPSAPPPFVARKMSPTPKRPRTSSEDEEAAAAAAASMEV